MPHQGKRHFLSTEAVAAEVAATVTRSSRQTPKPGMTLHPCDDEEVGLAQAPCWSFCPAGQERQEEDPAPEHVAQALSHVTHFDLEVAKYSFEEHVATQVPEDVKTGREEGHERQAEEPAPEQVSQSG